MYNLFYTLLHLKMGGGTTGHLWRLLEHKLISLKIDKEKEWRLYSTICSIFINNEIGKEAKFFLTEI